MQLPTLPQINAIADRYQSITGKIQATAQANIDTHANTYKQLNQKIIANQQAKLDNIGDRFFALNEKIFNHNLGKAQSVAVRTIDAGMQVHDFGSLPPATYVGSPPVNQYPPPVLTGSPSPPSWWQGVGIYCIGGEAGGNQCIQMGDPYLPPGAFYLAGPFQDYTHCNAACGLEPPPGGGQYCWDVMDGGRACMWWDGHSNHPAATIGDPISGPYSSTLQCYAACNPPTPSKYWCVCSITIDGGVQRKCFQSPNPPEGTCGGPYELAEACQKACTGCPGGLFTLWQDVNGLQGCKCQCQLDPAPVGAQWVSRGTYLSEGMCKADFAKYKCGDKPPPPFPYYCITQPDGSGRCIQTDAPNTFGGTYTGPYPTFQACLPNCSQTIQPPPPPPTPCGCPPIVTYGCPSVTTYSCPPVVQFPYSCDAPLPIIICDQTKPPPPPPPPPKGNGLTYNLWNPEVSDCYCTADNLDPNDANDVFVGSYDTIEECQSAGKEACKEPNTQTDLKDEYDLPYKSGGSGQVPASQHHHLTPDDKDPLAPLVQHLDSLRIWALNIGEWLMSGEGKIDGSFTRQMVDEICWQLGDKRYGSTPVAEQIFQWLTNSPMGEVIQGWRESLQNLFGIDPTNVQYLMATRNLLEAIGELSVDFGYKYGDETDNGTSFSSEFEGGIDLHIPVIKVGVEKKAKITNDWSRKYPRGTDRSAKTKLKLALIPVVEYLDRLIKAEAPDELPSVSMVIELVLANRIPEETAIYLVELQGEHKEVFALLLYARRTKLSVQGILEYIYRTNTDPHTANELADSTLRVYGFVDSGERQAQIRLYQQVPAGSDLQNWASKGLFSQDATDRFLYDQQFEELHWQKYEHEYFQQGISKELALQQWRAKYSSPHISQLQDALIRLRPGRAPQGLDFTGDDWELAFRTANIPPYWKERLQYLAYQPISMRYLRIPYLHGTIKPEQLPEYIQDQGFSPDNSKIMADGMELERRRQLATLGHGYTIQELSKLYGEGYIPKERAITGITYFGFTEEEAQQTLDRADEDFSISLNKETLTLARKGYLNGTLTKEEASATLGALGLETDTIGQYLSVWDLDRVVSTKQATEGELLTAFRDGLIDANTLAQRLLAYNYSPSAVGVILANTIFALSVKAEHLATKQLETLQKAKEKAAQQLERQILKQLKSEKSLDKIRVNLNKALRRADDLLAEAFIREQAIISKAETKDKVEKAQIQAQATEQIATIKAQETAEFGEATAQVDAEPPI